jgi:hypothetical protein
MLRFNPWCVGLFVIALCTLTVSSVHADLAVDGSIFNATFTGDAISATDWTAGQAWGSGSRTVADNKLTLQGATDGGAYVDSRALVIPDPTSYAVQVDFNATGVANDSGHEWELFSLYAAAGGTGGKTAIDLCLFGPTSIPGVYNLCWNKDAGNGIANLQEGQSYSVVASLSNGNVDIYVNGSLAATKPVIAGSTPVCIEIGDGYGAGTGTVQYTHVSMGTAVATPEPGTVTLLATGLFGLLAYAWRKRK